MGTERTARSKTRIKEGIRSALLFFGDGAICALQESVVASSSIWSRGALSSSASAICGEVIILCYARVAAIVGKIFLAPLAR